jgi:hypothetical protein
MNIDFTFELDLLLLLDSGAASPNEKVVLYLFVLLC